MTTTTQTTVKTYVTAMLREVAHLRNAKAEVRVEADGLQEYLDNLPEGKALATLRKTIADISDRLVIAENDARHAAVLAFKETGEKKGVEGAEVKEYTIVEITDKRAALLWAIQNCPDAVTLNESKFARAVERLTLPFIKVDKEPRGTIASDLTNLLEE